MRVRVFAILLLLLLGAAVAIFFAGEDRAKRAEERPQGEARVVPEAGASDEKTRKPRDTARPKVASQERATQERLYEELLHRVRLARERRIRAQESEDPDAKGRLSETEIVENLMELRSFFDECHEIAAATDPDIGDTAFIQVDFGVTERVVQGEVLVEDDEVVNADFDECVKETAIALDLRPLDGVRNIALQMEFDFTDDPSEE